MAELAKQATQAAQTAPPDRTAAMPQVWGAVPHSLSPGSALEVTVSGAQLRHLAQTCVRGAESQRDHLCSMDSSVGGGSLLQLMLELLQGEAMEGDNLSSGGGWPWLLDKELPDAEA